MKTKFDDLETFILRPKSKESKRHLQVSTFLTDPNIINQIEIRIKNLKCSKSRYLKALILKDLKETT